MKVRVVNGEYEYKIGNEWMKADNPNDPVKFKEIETKFAEQLKGEGKSALRRAGLGGICGHLFRRRSEDCTGLSLSWKWRRVA